MSQIIKLKRSNLNTIVSTLLSTLQKGEVLISTGSSGFPITDSLGIKNTSLIYLADQDSTATAANKFLVSTVPPPVLTTNLLNGVPYFVSGSTSNDHRLWILRDQSSGGHIEVSLGGGVIGQAEDSDYTDGLFTDFTPTTPIGTAIDRFNEVLKALAPAPAPDLLRIASNNVGSNRFIAFDNTANFSVSYNSVNYRLSPVPVGSGFNANSAAISHPAPPANRRQAVFGGTTAPNITIILNDNVPQDGINYPQDAFRVPDSNSVNEVYEIYVNGVLRQSFTVSSASAFNQTANDVQLNISAKSPASFPNAQQFDAFKHRTGTVTVNGPAFVPGYNQVYVRLIAGSQTLTTNEIDFVWDPQGASSVDFPLNIASPSTSNITPGGVKYLSGIGYYSTFTWNYTATVQNWYYATYLTSGINYTGLSAGVNNPSISIPTPTSIGSTVPVNSSFNIGSGVRYLGTAVTFTLSANNGLGKSTTNAQNLGTLLFDSVSDSTSNTLENFTGETYRLIPGTYNTYNSSTGNWDSTQSLVGANTDYNTGLMVRNGSLTYPSGDHRNVADGGSINYAPSNNPNYTSASGTRTYYRVARRTANGSIASGTITINGNATIVAGSPNNNSNQIKLELKVVNSSTQITGWRDIAINAPLPNTYTILADGVGCGVGVSNGQITISGTTNIQFSLASEFLSQNDFLLLRITAPQGWTGNINSINYSLIL